jgi:hypothetical protein
VIQKEKTMRPVRPSRHVFCVLVLAVILLSTHLTFHAQSTSQSSPSAATGAAQPPQGKVKCADNGTYVNSKGQTVKRPENCSNPPPGATAQCRDGTYSFSQSRRGTCSHHGGVANWL